MYQTNTAYISHQTLHDFCRACLEELKQQTYNIYGLNLEQRQWLQDVTLDNPLANDTYSSYICHLCHDKLKELIEFRNMCKRSRNTVLAILEKEKQKIKFLETIEDTKEEQFVLDKNQDWLAFDFVISNKKEPIVYQPNIDTGKVEVTVEPLINITIPQDTKEELEQIHHFKKEEISENEHESGSDYELEENYLNESSESDGNSELKVIPKTKTTSVTKTKSEKTKTTKTCNSSVAKKKLQVQCDECGRKCLNQQTLEKHKRTHLGLKPLQCPHCERGFDKSNHLQEHINSVHAENKFNKICEFEGCGKQYLSERSYNTHFRQKHLEDKLQLKHICEDCGMSYTHLAGLKRHQFTHKPKDQYPYQCTLCDKAFTKRYAFEAHQLRHAGIKNFECPHCGLKKTTKNELRNHMNYHTRAKQFHCPRCPMVCSDAGNLRRHEQLVHQGLRPFTCQFCEESFGKQDHLKRHEMRHTGEKPHVCTECGKGFIQKVALKTHMKTHNKYLAKLQIEPDGII